MRRLDHFVQLSSSAQQRLDCLGVERSWKQGEVLLHGGETPRVVVELKEGLVRAARVTTEGLEVLRRGVRPGGLLGLIAVVANRPFPYTVTAVSDCHARVYDSNQLLALMRSDGEFAFELAATIARWGQDCEDAAIESRHQPLVERVHEVLVRLRRLGAGRLVPGGFQLRVTQYDLACMVGTSRPYLNQQLHDLQDQGVVQLGYRTIVLRDPA